MVCIQSENLHGVLCHAKMRLESVEAHRGSCDDCLIVVLNTFRFLQQNKKKVDQQCLPEANFQACTNSTEMRVLDTEFLEIL